MNSGQYRISEKLVDLIHQDFGGFHPGYRDVHAQGRYYAGSFQATTEASKISRATHFQGAPIPVTIRHSNSASGNPIGPAVTTSMAVKFYLPDGTVTDLISLPIPLFLTRTPEETYELLEVSKPDPKTGATDPQKFKSFIGSRPWIANAVGAVLNLPSALSLAQSEYHALHAFRFVNTKNEVRFGRYHWIPQAGVAGQSHEELRAKPPTYLFEELETRLLKGPVFFDLVLELAEDGDPTDDPTAPWPEGRARVKLGELKMTRPTTVEEIGDLVMLHDPTRLTDGIELSEDPILSARRGIYELSAAYRTGGWKGRQAVLERTGCPFMGDFSAHFLPIDQSGG